MTSLLKSLMQYSMALLTNTAESITVSKSKFTSTNAAKEVTYNGNQN